MKPRCIISKQLNRYSKIIYLQITREMRIWQLQELNQKIHLLWLVYNHFSKIKLFPHFSVAKNHNSATLIENERKSASGELIS